MGISIFALSNVFQTAKICRDHDSILELLNKASIDSLSQIFKLSQIFVIHRNKGRLYVYIQNSDFYEKISSIQ